MVECVSRLKFVSILTGRVSLAGRRDIGTVSWVNIPTLLVSLPDSGMAATRQPDEVGWDRRQVYTVAGSTLLMTFNRARRQDGTAARSTS